jgi:hypothetical protein
MDNSHNITRKIDGWRIWEGGTLQNALRISVDNSNNK